MPIRVTRSVIPSLFTCLNLFCGFFAIVKTSAGDLNAAAWLIVMAGIADALDGMMARLTRSSSEFGVELDSLADVVSFGVVPSYMLYVAHLHTWGTLGVLIAALPAICGALRLARFNVQLVGFDKDYFRGLPIPAAALVLISYLVFHHVVPGSFIEALVPSSAKPMLLVTVTLAVSLLMVSTIRYDTLPKPTPRAIRAAPLKYLAIAAAIVLVVVTGGGAIFPAMSVYLVFGIVRQTLAWVRARREDEEDDDTMEEIETTPFDI